MAGFGSSRYPRLHMAKDFYQQLGLGRDASPDDIKKAYRKLSKELHPDKHKGDKAAETRFKEVNEAYETLASPEKKRMYDQFGSASGPGGGGAGFGGFGGGAGGFDFSSFSGTEGMNFSDLFEGFFGGQAGRGRGGRPERGDDHQVQLAIPFSEVVTGGAKTIRIRRLGTCDRCGGDGAEPGSKQITCIECGGTGQVTRTAQSLFGTMRQRMVCPKCKGSGKVPEKTCSRCDGEGRRATDAEVKFEVPAGIEDGQTLRVRGEGDAGPRGTTAGDLYVRIVVTHDDRFERDGPDIRTTLPIHVVDVVLGTEAEVETVRGPVKLRIPAGTQPGQVFRLKDKGLPVLGTGRTGDHFVTVQVDVPSKLSREEKKLMDEWKKLQK